LLVVDLLITSNEGFVSIRWYEMFAKFLCTSVFVKLVIQGHGGTATKYNRLRVLPWDRGFQMRNILQGPLRCR
jgi:hypothetical protein